MKTITKNQQKKIDEIMNNFDFEKMHLVMKMLNWKWAIFTDSDFGVPSVNDLKREAQRLLEDVIPSNWGEKITASRAGTGGFMAYYHNGLDNGKFWENLSLEFVVTDWFTEED